MAVRQGVWRLHLHDVASRAGLTDVNVNAKG